MENPAWDLSRNPPKERHLGMIKIILKATTVQWFWMNKTLQRRKAVLEGDVEMQRDNTGVLLCVDSLLRAN